MSSMSSNVFGLNEVSSSQSALLKTGTFCQTRDDANVSTASTENTMQTVESSHEKLCLKRLPINNNLYQGKPKIMTKEKNNQSSKSLLYSFGQNDMSKLIEIPKTPSSRGGTPTSQLTNSARKNLKIRVQMLDYSRELKQTPIEEARGYLNFENQIENPEPKKIKNSFNSKLDSLQNLLVFKPSANVKAVKYNQIRGFSPSNIISTPDSETKQIKFDFSIDRQLSSAKKINIPSPNIPKLDNDYTNQMEDVMKDKIIRSSTSTHQLNTKAFRFLDFEANKITSFRESRENSKIELPLLKNRSVQSSPIRGIKNIKSGSAIKLKPEILIADDFPKNFDRHSFKPSITPVAIKSPNSLLIDPFRTPKLLIQRETPNSRERSPVAKISTKFKNQDLILNKLFNPVSHQKKIGC